MNAEEKSQLKAKVLRGASSVVELEYGYELRFPGAEDWGVTLAQFITAERKTYSFMRYELVFPPDFGEISLKLQAQGALVAHVKQAFQRELESVRNNNK